MADMISNILSLAGLSPTGIEAGLTEAVESNHPALGELFPQYVTDSDNPEGPAAVIFRDRKLVQLPSGWSDAQRQACELVARFVPPRGEVVLNQTQISRILHQMRNEVAQFGAGATTIPMTCTGPFCPMVRDAASIASLEATGALPDMYERDLTRCKCSLYEAGVNPFGGPCPLEILRDSVLRRSLYDALQINPAEDAIHVHLISNLVGWIVLQQRVMLEIGIDPKMMVESETNAIPFQDTLTILKRKEVNPLILALDICQKHIDSLRKQLIATPEAQVKLKPRDNDKAGPVLTLKGRTRRELQEEQTYSPSDLLGEVTPV